MLAHLKMSASRSQHHIIKPATCSTEAYNVHLNNAQLLIENLSPTQHVLLVGDFNLGSIIWNNARANTFTADTDSELLLLVFIIYIWHEHPKSGKA